MRHLLKLSLLAILLFATNLVMAQQMPKPVELTDTAVRVGKLSNGLTYFIRHNEFPKGQADFHIAQKVGAVQENESQNGLAHFLEHMCFNGTEHFPDKALKTWLESIGVKFGNHLNAHTSTDETVYDITNVPVARETVIDSCLLILHDWACALTLDGEEIDKERGVIHEEWRMGFGAIPRLMNRHAPELYPGTQYATHDVIGSMDIVDNFEHQVLRDYYHKWYRPDLQAIIVVGDIDVDKVEQKVKDLFGKIKMPENAAKFTYQVVGDNVEPVVISDKDKEMPFNLLFVAQKFDLVPREMRNTDQYLLYDYLTTMIDIMLGERFSDLTLSSDSPFGGCSVSMGTFLYAQVKGALMAQAVVNEKGAESALEGVLTEFKKAREFGFTASEYERARSQYLSSLENEYNNRNSDKHGVYAQRYIQHFINNEPIVGVDVIYPALKDIVKMIPVEAVNQLVKQIITDRNLVVFSMSIDKEGQVMPTKEQLSKVIEAVKVKKVEAHKDAVVDQPLMPELPKAGTIVSRKENKLFGCTELTLSNGVKVILKPTNFKEDEIRLYAESDGGAALYSGDEYINVVNAADMVGIGGLGDIKYNDLMKLLSDKNISINQFIQNYTEGISAKTTPKDLETMMQLLYLSITKPRYDKEMYNTVKNLYLSQIENQEKDANQAFSDSLSRTMWNHHPKAAKILNKETINKFNYDRMMEIYKERFANAADFTFYVVGNFEEAKMEELLKQYVASLPASESREKVENDGRELVKGIVRNKFVFKNEGNLAMLGMTWSGNLDYTLENMIKLEVVGDLFSDQLLEKVREDEGAAYSPYAYGTLIKNFKTSFLVQAIFGLNPDKSVKSEELTLSSFENLAASVKPESINKFKEYKLKQMKESLRENGYWLNVLSQYYTEDLDVHTNLKDVVNSLTVEGMQDFINSLLKQGNRCEVLMMPN